MPVGPPATEFSRSSSWHPRRGKLSKAESSRPARRSARRPGSHTRKRPPARKPAAASILRARQSRQSLPRSRLRIAIADAIDRAVVLVGNEQGSILHLEDVGRTSVELVLLGAEKPLHERGDRGFAA